MKSLPLALLALFTLGLFGCAKDETVEQPPSAATNVPEEVKNNTAIPANEQQAAASEYNKIPKEYRDKMNQSGGFKPPTK